MMSPYRARLWPNLQISPLVFNLILFIAVHAESEITECNGFEECQKNIITNSYINCYGYGSCQGSIDTSNNDVGYIDCPSDNACSGSIGTSNNDVGYIDCPSDNA